MKGQRMKDNCAVCNHPPWQHTYLGSCTAVRHNPSTHDDVPCACCRYVTKAEPPPPSPLDELKALVKAFFDAETEWDALNIVKDNKQLVRDTAIKLDRARTALLRAAGLEP